MHVLIILMTGIEPVIKVKIESGLEFLKKV